jgi:hypothetical protein
MVVRKINVEYQEFDGEGKINLCDWKVQFNSAILVEFNRYPPEWIESIRRRGKVMLSRSEMQMCKDILTLPQLERIL